MGNGITRRHWVQTLLGSTLGITAFGSAGMLSRLARADNPDQTDRFFVLCYFRGGWDALLSLDPRDPAVFGNANSSVTQIQTGFELLPSNYRNLRVANTGVTFGPYIGDMLHHADRMAVVRGMSMETLTHQAGLRRFVTGKTPNGVLARGSSAATWIAATLGREDPVPNLSVAVENYNEGLPHYATALRVNDVPDLLEALQPMNPQPNDRMRAQLDSFLSSDAQCQRALNSPLRQAAESSRKQVNALVKEGFGALFDFSAPGPEMEQIRGHYGIGTNAAALRSPEAQAALAGRAIMGGLSRCVSIEVANGLDTHFESWATTQGPNQERGFNAVARLMEDLEQHEYKDGKSWLDVTTIVGFSEFSRTSMLNLQGGRDHSLTNACFVAGGGIRGGAVIGQTSDVGLNPQAIDLTTGQLDPAGTQPHPEHVWQFLYEQIGLGSEPDLRVPALAALGA